MYIDNDICIFVCFGSCVYVFVFVCPRGMCVCVSAPRIPGILFHIFFHSTLAPSPAAPHSQRVLAANRGIGPLTGHRAARVFLEKTTTKSQTRRRRRAPASMLLMPDCHRSHHDDSDSSRASAVPAAAIAKALDG
jgi:hypothetical protein